MISRSVRDARRSRTWRPVVPASPSIKIFLAMPRDVDLDADDVEDAKKVARLVNAKVEPTVLNRATRTYLLQIIFFFV